MTLFQWVIPIRLTDLVEIGLFAFILYKLYSLMRGTIAVQIFLGIFVLLGIQFLVTWLDMTMLSALFGLLSDVFVLAVIVLFQPEIRRLLLVLGQNPLIRQFVSPPARDQTISEIVRAVDQLRKQRLGGLIAIERSTGLRSYAETGSQIDAVVSEELLVTIFFEKNPLHDGAVIIRNNRIEAARCILPVSTSMKLSPHLGLRHRSAIGLSETTDAMVVVVSEESGKVSVAMGGELIVDVSLQELRDYLERALLSEPDAATSELPTAVNS
ncbi:MAG: diadenylate cyclase CdaA [Bacteroidetes bacterium]|nr:diadenylate cyclase CdaA [Bacteroidota bacterium]